MKSEISLNPFAEIYETDTGECKYSRFFRTSFLEKMEDTLYVFSGVGLTPVDMDSDKEVNRKKHAGICDYLFLGVPILWRYFWAWLNRGRPVQKLSDRQITILVPWALCRLFVSAVFTWALAPFVGIVHLVSVVWGGRKLKNIVKNIKIKPPIWCSKYLTPVPAPFGGNTSTLCIGIDNYLEGNSNSSMMTRVYLRKEKDSGNVCLDFRGTPFWPDVVSHDLFKVGTVSLSLTEEPDRAVLQALLDLNVGGVTEDLIQLREEQKRQQNGVSSIPNNLNCFFSDGIKEVYETAISTVPPPLGMKTV